MPEAFYLLVQLRTSYRPFCHIQVFFTKTGVVNTVLPCLLRRTKQFSDESEGFG